MLVKPLLYVDMYCRLWSHKRQAGWWWGLLWVFWKYWLCYKDIIRSWWRHQMETFSALLAICAGNSPGTSEFPAQRPVARSFDVFCDLRLNKLLSKQPWGWWFEMPSRPLWRHPNVLAWHSAGANPLMTNNILIYFTYLPSLPDFLGEPRKNRRFFLQIHVLFSDLEWIPLTEPWQHWKWNKKIKIFFLKILLNTLLTKWQPSYSGLSV